MTVDYYELLKIRPDASIEEIAAAYRKAALKHHPDRGGSHQKMVAVIEAWRILSDPALRAEYDRGRSQGMNAEQEAYWRRASQEVHERAEHYPQDFEQFWQWVQSDANAAKYGHVPMGSMPFPTAGNSATGWTFIVVGALAGAFVCYSYIPFFQRVRDWQSSYAKYAFLCLPFIGGAWAGQLLHRLFQGESGDGSDSPNETIAPVTPPEIQNIASSHEIISCPHCHRNLRLPKLNKALKVKCPSCGSRFTTD